MPDSNWMPNFRRSLKYLWPYRGRLIGSLVFVVLIGVLWGGGLGLVLPGATVMTSQEGLHGWAYGSVTGQRLGAVLVQQIAPAGAVTSDGQPLSVILNVVSVRSDGPAGRAGIKQSDWLIGITDGDHRLIRGDDLARLLSSTERHTLQLRVHDVVQRSERSVPVTLGEPGWRHRAMMWGVGMLGEPPEGFPGRFRIFVWILAVGLAMNLLRDVFRFFQEYLVATVVNRGLMGLRGDAYASALRLPMTYFSQHDATDTMSRFVQDSNELTQGQMVLLGRTAVEPAKAIASMVMALLISWELTVVALLAGPPVGFIISRLGRRMRRATRRALEGWSEVLGRLRETLGGIRVVKAYTMEGREQKRFFQANRRLLTHQNKIAKIDAATAPLIEALGITAAMLAAGVAAYWVFVRMTMTPETFLAAMACLIAMFDPLRRLSRVNNSFQRAEAAAARIFEVVDRTGEVSPPASQALKPHRQSIAFRNVSFRYPTKNDFALRDISLTVAAGKTVAFVGPNGSGKTTLLSLVPRLLTPTAGQVFIDEVDTADVSLRSLRGQIGLVTQDTVLFRASVADNIAYGTPRASREQILAAASKAFVDEFVDELPDGYDTIIGDSGSSLSGGQQQRIAIARAILRDPAILVFDEAMSQVDPESERRITQAMEAFVAGRTTLIIAHRLATVQSADQIVVMDLGRIVDIGTHQQLLGRCGLYVQLFREPAAAGGAIHG